MFGNGKGRRVVEGGTATTHGTLGVSCIVIRNYHVALRALQLLLLVRTGRDKCIQLL